MVKVAMKLEEKVMRKIYIIDQYRTLYGEKDIYEYYDRHKTYEGLEEYLKNKMKEMNCKDEETTD